MPCEISRRTQACINYTAGRRWLCSVRPPSRPPRHTEPRMRAKVDVHRQPFDRGILAGSKMHESRVDAKQGLSSTLSRSNAAQSSSYTRGIKSIVLPSVSTDDYQTDQHSILVCPMPFVKPTGPESAYRLAYDSDASKRIVIEVECRAVPPRLVQPCADAGCHTRLSASSNQACQRPMRSKARHSDRAFLNRSKWIMSSLTRCVADTEFMPKSSSRLSCQAQTQTTTLFKRGAEQLRYRLQPTT